MTSAPRIRVLVADDHLVVRFGVAAIVERDGDMEVVAQAASAAQVVELHRVHRPDVTLMDLRMPGASGVDAIAAIRAEFPDARIIVLTIHKGDEMVYRAIRAGASGYLLKDVPFQDLLGAIRAVHDGRSCIPPDVAEMMAERFRHDDLNAREIELLKLAAAGLSNKEIGVALDISESAVKHHMTMTLMKLGARDRTHAVALALDRSIIHLDEVALRRTVRKTGDHP